MFCICGGGAGVEWKFGLNGAWLGLGPAAAAAAADGGKTSLGSPPYLKNALIAQSATVELAMDVVVAKIRQVAQA